MEQSGFVCSPEGHLYSLPWLAPSVWTFCLPKYPYFSVAAPVSSAYRDPHCSTRACCYGPLLQWCVFSPLASQLPPMKMENFKTSVWRFILVSLDRPCQSWPCQAIEILATNAIAFMWWLRACGFSHQGHILVSEFWTLISRYIISESYSSGASQQSSQAQIWSFYVMFILSCIFHPYF